MEEVADVVEVPGRRLYSIRTLKAAGEKMMEIICDDAYGGSETCRVSALMLLNSFIALAKEERSNYIIDSMVRTNFILVLVETIKDIPQELRDSPARGWYSSSALDIYYTKFVPTDIPVLLSYYDSKFTLLLSISQTRAGASHITNAGLFQAVRASGLFSVDPDFGIGM
jgi:nuclear pore complex protein Nup205